MSVVLDINFDTVVGTNDFCALVFDKNHDGGTAPQTDDWYVECEFLGVGPVNTAKKGDGSIWVPQVWPADWDADVNDAGNTLQVYEFKINTTEIFTEVEGNVVGFGVNLYDVSGPDAIYWPDEDNPLDSPEDIPDRWGHLIYYRPMLLINKVSSNGTGNDEYIDLYNNCSTNITLHNINITDQDGNDATLPNITIPAYKNLTLRSGGGADEYDFSDNYGTVYIDGTDWWNDTGDNVLLRFNGNNCTFDYMQYGAGGEIDSHPLDTTSNSNWTFDTPPLSAPTAAQYLYRVQDGADTNMSSDWALTGNYQPDMWINGTIDNVYQSTPTGAQARLQIISAGDNATWWIVVQNDGTLNDTFYLNATFDMLPDWNWTMMDNATWTVVLNDTITTNTTALAGGEWRNYTLNISSPLSALPGDESWVIINATSQNDTSKMDAVNASARISSAPADHLEYVSGDGQTGNVGTSVLPFWARVVDQFGNNVSGATVWWNITDIPAGATGQSLSNATSISDANGLVSTTLTLGNLPGWYNVTCANLSLPSTPDTIQYNTTATVGAADHLEYVSGNGQSGNVGTSILPFWARVVDQFGNNVSGAIVWWNITDIPGGAVGQSLNNATSVSDTNGLVSTTLTLGNLPGWYNVTCANLSLPGTPDTIQYNTTATVGVADHLEYVSGDGQTGNVGTFVSPFWARVVDQFGNNVSGATIWWNITDIPAGATGQSLSNVTSISDANGLVSTTLTLGNLPGWYNVTCANLSLPGTPDTIQYNTTATVGAADHLEYVSGDGQTGNVGTSVLPFWARVVDQFGNNVSGATVWWNITDIPAGATGQSLSNATSISDANGLVSTTLTLGNLPGWYNVTCANLSLPGTPDTIQYNTTATVGAADHLEYVSGNGQTGNVGTSVSPFWARVVDQFGNNVSGATVWWNITDIPAGATGQSLSNPTSISDANGLVSTTLTLGNLPGWYNVTCANLSLPGTPDTIQYNTTAIVGVADHLEYVSGNGQTGNVGTSVSPFWARVVDQFGNNVSGATVWWNITDIPAGATGQSLSNATSISDANGLVSTKLTLGNLPGWYNVTCANLSLPGTPATIQYNTTATVGPLASIEMVANPTTVQVTGNSALTIWANDSFGNQIPGLTINLGFDTNPSAPNAGVTSSATDANNDGIYDATYTAGQTAWVTDVVRASCGAFWDTVSISVEADVPYRISYVSGNGQSKTTGETLDAPFLVRVDDQYGNPIPGVEIGWVVNGTPSGASGQAMSPQTNLTNASGIAGSVLRLGDKVGWYFITATNATLALVGEPVNFSAEAILGILNIVIISGNDQSATAGTTLPQPLVVEVQHQDGTPAGSGIKVWFNVTSGGGTIETTNPVLTDSNGRAQTTLTLGPDAGLNTVTAEISSTGVSQVTFVAVATLPHLSPHLAVNVSSVVAGQSFYYLLSFDNDGSEPAADVWINDTLPSSISYLSDSSGVPHNISGNTYSWYFSSVSVGSHSFVVTCLVKSGTSNGTQISNYFTVDYSDQAGRLMSRETSNTVTITALSEPVENIPPVIEGVPDLIVHYDWDYMIDLSSYITDPDTPPEALFLIFSDTLNARVDAANNLVMVLNYSIDYRGTTQVLNITVSDGMGSDWDIINVTVTDNFPPEIVKRIPDIVVDEDTVSYPFTITDYFFDREGDALYYVFGNIKTNITVLDNGTVRVTAEINWYGMERVRFRAAQKDTGALVEQVVTITVRPVNDPPIVLPIPDQRGRAGEPWSLDITPYLQDVDNALSDLHISTDSGQITIAGTYLTFRYSQAGKDIIMIIVSDGEAQAYMQVNVSVEAAPAPPPIPPWLLPLVIILGAVGAIIFVAYKRRKPLVEQAFLTYKDGTLIAHATSWLVPELDSDLFASMLRVIQDFVKDSFKDEKDWGLKRLEFGGHKIAIERDKRGVVSLALVYRGKGDDARLSKIASRVLGEVEKSFGAVLRDWDGNLDRLRGTRDILIEHLFKR
ncbi:MAG: lamin tail domain-containing protein [Candidatus Thermoplasmatota archaeon]